MKSTGSKIQEKNDFQFNKAQPNLRSSYENQSNLTVLQNRGQILRIDQNLQKPKTLSNLNQPNSNNQIRSVPNNLDLDKRPVPNNLDLEKQGSEEPRPKRKRPLVRRIVTYFRVAWTGVKSALDSEFEELETPARYRPDSLSALCKSTKFSEAEIKRIYRGFKAECPTGLVKEETFKMIYAQFFPQGANTNQYAHYIFQTLDQDQSGIVSFEDFVQGLSILSRGTLEEKLRWTFHLYDINRDGNITKEEMTEIVAAVYDLMGKLASPIIETDTVKEKVEQIFKKMDTNNDGLVTEQEFLESCLKDEDMSASLNVFDSNI